jgi:hypothetical protein
MNDLEAALDLIKQLTAQLDLNKAEDFIVACDALKSVRELEGHFTSKLRAARDGMSLKERVYFSELMQDMRVKEKRYQAGITSDIQRRFS